MSGTTACGLIGLAAVAAAYLSRDHKSQCGVFFWLLAVFALIGAANA